jgi:hypothetical protein
VLVVKEHDPYPINWLGPRLHSARVVHSRVVVYMIFVSNQSSSNGFHHLLTFEIRFCDLVVGVVHLTLVALDVISFVLMTPPLCVIWLSLQYFSQHS